MQLVALGGIEKMARTSSPCRFWRFSFFASGRYTRTAPLTRKRNLSHFLEVSQRVEICNWTFSTRCRKPLCLWAFVYTFLACLKKEF